MYLAEAMTGTAALHTIARPCPYTNNDPLNKTDPTGMTPQDDDFLAPMPESCFAPHDINLLPMTGADVPPATPVLVAPGYCGDALTSPSTPPTTARSYQQMIDSIGAAASPRRNIGSLHVGCNPDIGCVSQGLYGPPSTHWSGSGKDVWVDVDRILSCKKDGGKFCGPDRLKVVVLHEMAHGASLHVMGNLAYPGTLIPDIEGLMSREDALALLVPAGVSATLSGDQFENDVWEPLSDCIAVRWGAPSGNLEHGCPANLAAIVDRVLA